MLNTFGSLRERAGTSMRLLFINIVLPESIRDAPYQMPALPDGNRIWTFWIVQGRFCREGYYLIISEQVVGIVVSGRPWTSGPEGGDGARWGSKVWVNRSRASGNIWNSITTYCVCSLNHSGWMNPLYLASALVRMWSVLSVQFLPRQLWWASGLIDTCVFWRG